MGGPLVSTRIKRFLKKHHVTDWFCVVVPSQELEFFNDVFQGNSQIQKCPSGCFTIPGNFANLGFSVVRLNNKAIQIFFFFNH